MALAILTLILGFGILASCMIAQQEKMIYIPRPYSGTELKAFQLAGVKRLDFETAEGSQAAFWKPPAMPNQGLPFTWLIFSGNGGCAMDYRSVARSGPTECGWLFVDYPGYGACHGSPNPSSIRANALGAIDALAHELNTTRDELTPHLGSFGHSIGCAAALDIAAETGLKRAVVVSPFTSMKEMAARFITPLLTGFLRHRFDNRASLERLEEQGTARVAIFHGTTDAMIPSSMGRELAAAYPEITSFTPIEGAGHNDVIDLGMATIAQALRP